MDRVIEIPPDDEYIERFGLEAFINRWHVPEGCHFLPDVCYEDGAPIIYSKELIIKVGKRKWVKLIFDET